MLGAAELEKNCFRNGSLYWALCATLGIYHCASRGKHLKPMPFAECAIHSCRKLLPAGQFMDFVEYVGAQDVQSEHLGLRTCLVMLHRFLLTKLFTETTIWQKTVGGRAATCAEQCCIHGGLCAECLESCWFSFERDCKDFFYTNGDPISGPAKKILEMWERQWWHRSVEVDWSPFEILCLSVTKWKILFERWGLMGAAQVYQNREKCQGLKHSLGSSRASNCQPSVERF